MSTLLYPQVRRKCLESIKQIKLKMTIQRNGPPLQSLTTRSTRVSMVKLSNVQQSMRHTRQNQEILKFSWMFNVSKKYIMLCQKNSTFYTYFKPFSRSFRCFSHILKIKNSLLFNKQQTSCEKIKTNYFIGQSTKQQQIKE